MATDTVDPLTYLRHNCHVLFCTVACTVNGAREVTLELLTRVELSRLNKYCYGTARTNSEPVWTGSKALGW